MQKTTQFGMVLTPLEKHAISLLAEIEGGLSIAALVRLLVRKAAIERGVWHEINIDQSSPTITHRQVQSDSKGHTSVR